ncbi:glycosyltransferase family 4 protein [Spirulina sp. 06S082]|uniref:glycosyltransferase family 4 protein n=1 Tax=Spirulina sp. 06S082 TaxID=3110248 RepID=UPI002B21CB1D|nr:glycosyltransferase family 4 protein [Spirulina sp. 06S082]MEA5470772.1 glycosyltransferase family 4 protein [Spirulina sp. 06S082]
MNILMISSTFPYPPSRSGTEVRTFNLLKALQNNHSVTLIAQRSPQVSDRDIEEMKKWVDDLIVFPLAPDEISAQGISGIWAKGRRFLESALKGIPANVLHRYSPEIQALVDRYVTEGKCDAITCEHSANAVYIRPQFRDRVRTVVNVHSSIYWGTINYIKMGASENPSRDRLYLPILYRYEKNYCDICDRIVVTTEDDARQLQQLSPDAKISIITNGVDLELFPYRRADPGGHHLIFLGAMHFPHNIDAVRFFVLKVLPQLREQYPDVTYSIVGNRPVPEVLALAEHPGVVVTGRVPSMVDSLHQATACVVSLQTGFGIKNKTIEAMAAGVPVIGSDRGLEGLEIEGENIPLRALRANTVAEYISAIDRLFREPDLRQTLSQNGRQLIEQNYTWKGSGQKYEQALMGDDE